METVAYLLYANLLLHFIGGVIKIKRAMECGGKYEASVSINTVIAIVFSGRILGFY